MAPSHPHHPLGEGGDGGPYVVNIREGGVNGLKEGAGGRDGKEYRGGGLWGVADPPRLLMKIYGVINVYCC